MSEGSIDAVGESSQPEFAAYPRQVIVDDPAERLAALAAGYRGLNRAFALSFLLNMVGLALAFAEEYEKQMYPLAWAMFAIGALVAGVMTYAQLQNIARGAGWSQVRVLVLTMTMVANAWILGGIILFAVLQQLTTDEMKKLGVRAGFVGPSETEITRAIAELRDREPAKPWAPVDVSCD